MSPEVVTIGMFAGLLIGLFLGHPLAFVLGGLAVIFGYLGWGTTSFYMFLNRTWGTMDNYILVCIPLFILMAQLLDQSGVAEDLFDTMRYLFGPIPRGILCIYLDPEIHIGRDAIIEREFISCGYRLRKEDQCKHDP